ncbi:MAG: xylulokinase [Phycisphaerales bacterium]|nr:xylulokinase [Phycisphaerales bacterium]
MIESNHAPLLLGIDIGTTGAKVLLVDARDANAIAHRTVEYPLHMPRPNWCEQDPHDWWRATATAVRQVMESERLDPARIAGIGLSGQMHGLVALDAAGEVIRPAILWNDQRTAAECDIITQRLGEQRLIQLTGNIALTGFTAPKIIWMQRHEPEAHGRIASIMLPKDYIRYRMSGERFTDVADASGTLLLDVAHRAWSSEMLDALQVPRAWLPTVTESDVASTRLGAEAARELGLLAGTPIAAGGGDQAAQAVGSGIVEEGMVCVTIGTSGVVFAPTAAYRPEPRGRLHAFCHAVPGMWHLMGVMLSAGGSLRWFRDLLGDEFNEHSCYLGKDPYDLLTEEASHIAPGADGLIFLPYLTGERTPHNDPNARGVFCGLSLHHRRPHLARAVLEGITFGLRDSLDLLVQSGVQPREIRVSGGGARSAMWRQMIADVFDAPVTACESPHGAAMGAALLAGVAAGCFESVPAASSLLRLHAQCTAPGPAAAAYAPILERYRGLYPALAGRF